MHRYYPGLDGLRALAVIAVLFFHAGERQAVGGFLGVSLFFTLSGFLITGLLIGEFSSNGRIRIRAFWGRRIRRLMPAAVVCLGLVLVLSPWLVKAVSVVRLRADVVAAAADVANWRFVTAHQSYAELFARQPSAVLHFWSLAIEEQFYLVYPCIIAVLARLGRRRPWVLPLGLVAIIAVSIMSSLLATSHDLIYYGTHTRAAELLIGGLLAWVVQSATAAGAWRRRATAVVSRHVVAVQAIAFGALAVFVILVTRTSQSDEWLYRGGFAVLGLLWCVLIVAARAPGAFGSLVSTPPLVAIGRRSYGIYLFHWPVFTLITPARLGVHGWPARLIQLLIVAAITELSYRLIERPIRLRRVLTDRVFGPAVALACISAVIAAAVVLPGPTTTSAGSTLSLAAIPDAVVHLSASSTSTDPAVPEVVGATPAGSASRAPSSSPSTIAGAPMSGARTATDPSPEPGAGAASTVVPAVRITVIGSAPTIGSRVGALASTNPAWVVTDETVDGCSVVSATRDAVGDGSCVPVAADRTLPPDVTVVGIGPAEHAAIQGVLASTPGETGAEQYAAARDLTTRGVAEFERLGQLAPTVLIVDAEPRSASPDLLDQIIDEAVLSTPTMRRTALDDIAAATLVAPAPSAAAPSLKVMVIGDSTSYGFAEALASSPVASFDVLWAGKRNCPIARMDSIRWLTGDEFSMKDCPSIASVWPEQIATFRPDVIVIDDGLPEESLQKYPGDDAWHEVGDPAFNEIHHVDSYALLELAATVGAVVVIADQPHDAPDTSSMWATPARINAWNALVHAWDQAWAPVAVLPYGPAVEAAEAAAGHSLRPDGLHLDKASNDSIIGQTLAPILVAQVGDLRTVLAASGCRMASSTGATLDLTRCH